MTYDPSLWLTNAHAHEACATFCAAGGNLDTEEQTTAVVALALHAPSLWPLLLNHPGLLQKALETPLELAWQPTILSAKFSEALHGIHEDEGVRKVLRTVRHQALIRLALREILRLADVEQSSAEMSTLADATVQAAISAALHTFSERHGLPRDASGKTVPLVVLGMGKLGGKELNLGSDIDVCFFYLTDDGTCTDSSVSVHDFYTRVVRHTCQSLSEITEDGFCFRVDLRLRPEGRTGPLVNSLSSAERYYESWGQTWERAALLRARPIAGDIEFGQTLLKTLEPFVYRRPVVPAIAAEMHSLLTRTRRELGVDEHRDIKLGSGGIREAEFFVQSLQLIWGGRHPQLRVPGTIDALTALRNLGLISDRESESLTQAWTFLRRLEHAIHLRTGYQTHLLPTDSHEQHLLATSLGLENADTLFDALHKERDSVRTLAKTLDPASQHTEDTLETLWDSLLADAPVDALRPQVTQVLHVSDADEAIAHLKRLGKRADFPLGRVSRERQTQIGLALLKEARDCADPLSALHFLVELFNRLGSAGLYAEWLTNTPLLRRLVTLFANSPFLSSQLVSHPEIIEGVLAPHERIHVDMIHAMHEELFPLLTQPNQATETTISRLRAIKRDCVLRTGLNFVNSDVAIYDTGILLTHLAEEQLQAALTLAMQPVQANTTSPWPEPIVCALGKLGGRELGFSSDLDLFFLYDERCLTDEQRGTAVEVYSKVAQNTLRFLSQPNVQGPGYDLDTRLRPSGRQGLLVVSVTAFEHYHATRAAAWERQALIRARALTGNTQTQKNVSVLLKQLAFEGTPTPITDLRELRSRMQTELAVESTHRYDPKYGYGGLVDIEFIVQWLQMRHGRDVHLQIPHTHDALTALSTHGYLPPHQAQHLSEAYRWLRMLEQFLQLMKPHSHTFLSPQDPMLDKLAFVMRIRPRDGLSSGEALMNAYRRYTEHTRSLFEEHMGALPVSSPWRLP